MIFSRAKLGDMEFRKLVLERMKHLADAGDLETLKEMAAISQQYKKRIETRDYTEEDAFLDKFYPLSKSP